MPALDFWVFARKYALPALWLLPTSALVDGWLIIHIPQGL